ncbi:MAG: hypothetical protein H7345_17900 [Rubritepida sp.]|nr:hypothetical protein [Rubritepida sp.]
MSGSVPEWIGTGLTIIAALMVSLDLGRRITGYGFLLFAVSSLFWLTVARQDGQPGRWLPNPVLFSINLMGVWRCLVLKKPA